MKLLVTGGTGFIGRHVVAEALRRGHSVRVLTHRSPPMRTDVEFIQHDLRQLAGLGRALDGIDAAIHCTAAMAGDLDTQLAVTVEGTRNLLSAMKEAGVRHVLGISTLALYDYLRIPDGSVLKEDSPLDDDFDARAPYIRAKRQQEDMIREQSEIHRWRWTILRPGIVYGPDRTWFHHLGMHWNADRWVCFAGDSLLPLIYVENCAEAILNALDSEAANGATMNIVDDDLPERRRYMEALALRTTPRPRIIGVPWGFLDRAARTASWTNTVLLGGRAALPDLLQSANLHARSKPLRYSNERAKRTLGWKPQWSLEQSLDRIFVTDSPVSPGRR